LSLSGGGAGDAIHRSRVKIGPAAQRVEPPNPDSLHEEALLYYLSKQWPQMEAALAKSWSPDAVANVKTPAAGLNADIHGSAEYRAHLVGVLARRAVAEAIGKPAA